MGLRSNLFDAKKNVMSYMDVALYLNLFLDRDGTKILWRSKGEVRALSAYAKAIAGQGIFWNDAKRLRTSTTTSRLECEIVN